MKHTHTHTHTHARREQEARDRQLKPTIHLSTKVDLAHIILAQHSLITSIRCVVSSYMVQRTSSRERNTSSQSINFHQVTIHLFQSLTDINHTQPRTNPTLHILTYLAVALGGIPSFVDLVGEQVLNVSLFLTGSTPLVPVVRWGFQ